MHSSKKALVLVTVLLITTVLCGVTLAQTFENFTNIVASTGRSQPIIVQNFQINGSPAGEGDEIGLFDGTLLVARAKIVTGSISPSVMAAILEVIPPVGSTLPGAKPGNNIIFKAWQKSSGTETGNVVPTFQVGNGTFGEGHFRSFRF